MPIVQPNQLREKILLIGPGKTGKSSSWISIAYYAFISGDTRKFFVIDTDLAVRDVLNEPKYAGMLAEEGGNIHLFEVVVWDQYVEAADKILAEAVQGDWIVIDFVTHAWTAVQEAYLLDVANKGRSDALLDAAKEGLSGWEMYQVDFNWPVINAMYYGWMQKMLLKSRAHIFMVSEQDEINEKAKKLTADAKAHLADFGKYKFIGNKKLPYQCRSYLRLQRLARGRVLFTQGDRARKELNGDDMSPDFFRSYLVDVAGWSYADPE